MAAEIWILLALSFLPPILWLVWIRNLEIREREPWFELAKMFLWGATLGVILALLLSQGLFYYLGPWWAERGYAIEFVAVTAVIVAPIAEEPAKALGLTFLQDAHQEPEDGLVYGAAVGLGFSATENLIYGAIALSEGGLGSLLLVVGIRSFASAFLHASASALVGYGFLRTGDPVRRVLFLALAILLHMSYNALLSADGILGYYYEETSLVFAFGAFVGALLLSVVTFKLGRRQVQKLDAASA